MYTEERLANPALASACSIKSVAAVLPRQRGKKRGHWRTASKRASHAIPNALPRGSMPNAPLWSKANSKAQAAKALV